MLDINGIHGATTGREKPVTFVIVQRNEFYFSNGRNASMTKSLLVTLNVLNDLVLISDEFPDQAF